jgi:hypothetical protein
VKSRRTWVVGSDVSKPSLFLRNIFVFRRFGHSSWRQVGVIIGVLGGKPDKIETGWLGQLESEDIPHVLGGPARFLKNVPRVLGGPVGRERKKAGQD